MVNHFFAKKVQIFLYFVPYDCVQISSACDPNTYHKRNFRLQISVSNGNKMPDRKIHFCYKFAIIPAAVANAETGKLCLYIHYFIRICATRWRNLNQIVWSEMCKIFSFLTKIEFIKTIFYKVLTPFCKTFVRLKQLFNGKLSIFTLLAFSVPKIMVVGHV